MTFVYPLLLGGLLLMGVPVLLHLIMRPKPKRLPFPAFRFLVQRHQSNQRKLRLRQLLLLALRVFLLAAICLALARPKIFSERIHLSGDRSVAAVLLFDTSYSMEYTVNGRSRLDEAKRRAQELLDELPEGSRIAILDTAEPGGEWLSSVALARERIDRLRLRHANGPLTSRLGEAYRLLTEMEQAVEDTGEGLPRFLYLFSDRTQQSWDPNRLQELQQARDRLTPGLNAVFVDVGVENPADLAITDLKLPRQRIAADGKLLLHATVQATGVDGETELICRIDAEKAADRKPIKLAAGQSQVITFERSGLAPGPHQAEVTLATSDALPFTNARFATFQVQSGRRVLILVDDSRDATVWKWALEELGDFHCDVRLTAQARQIGPRELEPYQAVCLLSVAQPENDLWEKLEQYVGKGNGLAVIPGEELNVEAYAGPAAQRLLPGRFVKDVAGDSTLGTLWNWTPETYRHPALAPFREWNKNANIDFGKYERGAFRYWEVEPDSQEADVLVAYKDNEHRPALLERAFPRKKVRGRVLLFTTPLDGRSAWNNYADSLTSFYLVLANKMVGYLAGDAEAINFNFVSGQMVSLALPATPRSTLYSLQGPGLEGSEVILPRPENQSELTVSQAVAAGNYTLSGADGRRAACFSVNVPPDECQLGRVPLEQIEALLGAGAVLTVGHSALLRDALQGHWGQPVELLPWLMILLLLVLAIENLLANKFYRRETPDDKETRRP
jgi:hypothetical protein